MSRPLAVLGRMGEKLELKLKSPVGAEAAGYPWPLPVYVSTIRLIVLIQTKPTPGFPCRSGEVGHVGREQRVSNRVHSVLIF